MYAAASTRALREGHWAVTEHLHYGGKAWRRFNNPCHIISFFFQLYHSLCVGTWSSHSLHDFNTWQSLPHFGRLGAVIYIALDHFRPVFQLFFFKNIKLATFQQVGALHHAWLSPGIIGIFHRINPVQYSNHHSIKTVRVRSDCSVHLKKSWYVGSEVRTWVQNLILHCKPLYWISTTI